MLVAPSTQQITAGTILRRKDLGLAGFSSGAGAGVGMGVT